MLTGREDSVTTLVAGLQSADEADQVAITTRDAANEEKRREQSTVFYVIGDKRTLTTAGVIAPKGGVLGLGRTLQLTGRYDARLFKSHDTDQERVVTIPSPKVQVMSAQAKASYELRTVGRQVDLHILDTAEYRKVKHLVVLPD